jgi:hypothetical protein
MEVSSETTQPVQQQSENDGESSSDLEPEKVSIESSSMEVSSETTQPVQQQSENDGESSSDLEPEKVSIESSSMEVSSETTQPVQQQSENDGESSSDLEPEKVSIENSSMEVSSENIQQICRPVEQVSENVGESPGDLKYKKVSIDGSFMEVSGETFPYIHLDEEVAENADDFLFDFESETVSSDETKDHSSVHVSSKPNSPCKVVQQIADRVGKSPRREHEMLSNDQTTDGSSLHVSSTSKTIPLPQPPKIMAEYVDSESDATSDIIPFTVSILKILHSILKLY